MSNIAIYWGKIPEDTFGGIDRVCNLLAKGFTDAGHKVFLIYSGGNDNIENNLYLSKYKYIRPERGGGPESTVLLKKFFNDNAISIIINQRAFDFNIIKSLRRAAGDIPIISCFHSSPGFEYFSSNLAKRIIKKLRSSNEVNKHYNELLQHSNSVVLLASSFIETFKKIYSIKQNISEKLLSIPNPLSFVDDINDSIISLKAKIILYVGRLSESPKRISKLLKMWRLISSGEGYDDWHLVIIGHGPDEQRYKDYVRNHNLQRVSFEGKQDPRDYYKRASIFTITSDYEGFPLVLTEAMQFGCVPIAFDTFSSLRDIIDNDKNGIIIKRGNFSEYVINLKKIMNHQDKREQMAVKAIEKSQAFSLPKVISRWNLLFSQLENE